MEDSINITTVKPNGETSITIDNTTDFKDFVIDHKETNHNRKITFQIDVEENVLEINGFDLSSTELYLLKQFLNQLK